LAFVVISLSDHAWITSQNIEEHFAEML